MDTIPAHQEFLVNLSSREQLLDSLSLLTDEKNSSTPHTLCYLDIDQFRVINYTYNLATGDELLVKISMLLQEILGPTTKLCWLYGDTFAFLLLNSSNSSAKRIINKIHDSVSEFRFQIGSSKIAITVSIGAVQSSEEINLDPERILMFAENACRIVKDRGGDGSELIADQAMLDVITNHNDEMRWVERINQAFEEDRFHLHYQKIISLNPAIKDVHYELLIRMTSVDGELVPPGHFLPAAEKYKLGVKIDKWVIQTAFSWLETYDDILNENISWGINLSGQSLANADLRDFVIDQIRRKNITPKSVFFEITETAVITNIDNAIEFIDAVHAMGCKVALDDFGSGLSSFGYLKTLPVDYIKIDGLFIKNIINDAADLSMVKSIKGIADSLGKKTIAEFVENDEIKKKLQEISIDFAQGYGIKKPFPLARFEAIEKPGN